MMVGGDSLAMGGFNFIKPLVKPPVNGMKDLFHGLGANDHGDGDCLHHPRHRADLSWSSPSSASCSRLLMVGRAKAIPARSRRAWAGLGDLLGHRHHGSGAVLVDDHQSCRAAGRQRRVQPQADLPVHARVPISALVSRPCLAATAVDGGNAVFALQIALVHFSVTT